MRHGRELLLLVDEAEVLIEIGQTESAWARLRKAMQEGNLRRHRLHALLTQPPTRAEAG